MTELLCKICDREIFENESERNSYKATFRKRNDKGLYKKYTVYNVNLDEFDKILSDYMSHQNKKFCSYFLNCEFQIEFDNNFTANIEISCHYNTDTNNIKSYLLYYIDSCKSARYNFNNNKYMIIKTINCMCNMTYEYYINTPMQMFERRLNMIFAKNPQLIN